MVQLPFEQLKSLWDTELNSQELSQISSVSPKKYWWRCENPKHVFEFPARNMFNSPGCRVCSGKVAIAGVNDLETTHPELVESWDFTSNGTLRPSHVTANMGRKVNWICPLGHSWQISIADRTNVGRSGKPSMCPYCSNRKVLKGFNDLASRFPMIASEWDIDENRGVAPDEVSFGSPKLYNWKCKEGHKFRSRIADRTGRGIQCSTCTNQKLLVGFNDLATTNPKLASQWHPTLNGDKTPAQVQGGSWGKAWWICEFGHPWEAEIRQRRNKDSGCSVCQNLTVLEGTNDLATTHPNLTLEWHAIKNGELLPTKVVAGSNRKVWWQCRTCGCDWSASLSNRTNRQSGCPSCSSGGYDQSKPGLLYLLSNSSLRARKIGITNPTSKQNRLADLSKVGWVVLESWEHQSGSVILELETRLLQILRGVYKLPPFLSKTEMGKLGGWSETFSEEGPNDLKLIQLVNLELEAILKTTN